MESDYRDVKTHNCITGCNGYHNGGVGVDSVWQWTLIFSEEQWDPEVFTDTKVPYFLL